MKTLKIISLGLVLCVSAISVSAASPVAIAANQHWNVQLFKSGEGGVKNLSTAFVGEFQYPILSYAKTGQHRIYWAHAATQVVAGNCGPNSAWRCDDWIITNLLPETVSEMAAFQGEDSHTIQWAYSTGSMIRGATLELNDDMSFIGASLQDLVQLSKFGGTLMGAPSLQTVQGHYRLAAVVRDSSDFYTHSLVYMRYTGDMNTSCLNAGSSYQCDVIEQSYGIDSMGAPSLRVGRYGPVGIAYFKSGEGLKYADPLTFPYPTGCGPGGNSWGCITIYEGDATGAVGSVADLAFGQTRDDRSIAFTYKDDILHLPLTLFNAQYVSSGGNCGAESYSGTTVYRWKCRLIAFLGEFPVGYAPSFSIDIDPLGYPVIAFDYGGQEPTWPLFLYLAYPNARSGNSDPGWTLQPIDGVLAEVDTGALAAISLNNGGLGLIGYLQEEDYMLPDLKIAYQLFQIDLPLIWR